MKQSLFQGIKSSHAAYGQHGIVVAISLSRDGQRLLAGSDQGALQLFHGPSGNCLQTIDAHDGAINVVAFVQDERLALSGGEDGSIKVWDLASGQCQQTLEGHSAAIRCLHRLPGRLLASGGDDGSLRIWDYPSGQCLQRIKAHRQSVSACHALSEWRYLLTGGADRSIRLWDLVTAKKLTELDRLGGHVAEVSAIRSSYDDRVIVSASKDCTVRVWDLATRRASQVLSAHDNAVMDMSLSLDGKYAASIARDGEIRLWHMLESNPLEEIRPMQISDPVVDHRIELSENKQVLAATDDQDGLMFYQLDWDYQPVSLSDDRHEGRYAYYDAFLRRQTRHRVKRNVRSSASEISIASPNAGRAQWTTGDLQRLSQLLLHALHLGVDARQLGNNLEAYQQKQELKQQAGQMEELADKPANEPPPRGFTLQYISSIAAHIGYYLPSGPKLAAIVVSVVMVVALGYLVYEQVDDRRSAKQVEELVSDGANPNRLKIGDQPALHAAAHDNHRETIRTLLASGVDINLPDRNGWTVLHYAAANNDQGMVEFLLEQGAEPQRRAGRSRVTPHWIASRNGNREILLLMKPRSAASR